MLIVDKDKIHPLNDIYKSSNFHSSIYVTNYIPYEILSCYLDSKFKKDQKIIYEISSNSYYFKLGTNRYIKIQYPSPGNTGSTGNIGNTGGTGNTGSGPIGPTGNIGETGSCGLGGFDYYDNLFNDTNIIRYTYYQYYFTDICKCFKYTLQNPVCKDESYAQYLIKIIHLITKEEYQLEEPKPTSVLYPQKLTLFDDPNKKYISIYNHTHELDVIIELYDSNQNKLYLADKDIITITKNYILLNSYNLKYLSQLSNTITSNNSFYIRIRTLEQFIKEEYNLNKEDYYYIKLGNGKIFSSNDTDNYPLLLSSTPTPYDYELDVDEILDSSSSLYSRIKFFSFIDVQGNNIFNTLSKINSIQELDESTLPENQFENSNDSSSSSSGSHSSNGNVLEKVKFAVNKLII